MDAQRRILSRSQSSMELLITLGFGLIILVPVIILAFMQVSSSSSSLDVSIAQGTASKLAGVATAVGSQGYSARQTVLIQVPPNVQNIYVGTQTNLLGREIIFVVKTKSGLSYVTAYTPVNVSGYLEQLSQPGTYLVNVSATSSCPTFPSQPCVYLSALSMATTTTIIPITPPALVPTSISSPASSYALDDNGQSVTVSVTTPTTGSPPYTYSWAQASGYTCPSGPTSSSASSFTYTPTSTGTCKFTVTVKDSATGSYQATTPTMTVSSGLSSTSASASPTSIVSSGQTSTISVTAPNTGSSPYTYSWAVTSGYSCPGNLGGSTTSWSYTPSSGTAENCEFTVTVTDSANTHEQYTATTPTITVSAQISCGCCYQNNIESWYCSGSSPICSTTVHCTCTSGSESGCSGISQTCSGGCTS